MEDNILNNVKWGNPALKLLSHFKNLDENYPTALLIRHSERNYSKDLTREGLDDLTPRGEKAAFEFGSILPAHLKYWLFSSPSPRCKNTSRNIQAGIQGNGGIADLNGILSYIRDFHIDLKQVFEYTKRDGRKYLIRWISGFYPHEAIILSIETAMKTLKNIKENLSAADSITVHIHISHDIYIAGTIFHLLGWLDPKYAVQYLDGLLLQFVGDQIHVFHKNGEEKVHLHHWWREN